MPVADRVTAESINSPAIGDLDGDGRDEIIAASNEVYGAADQAGGDVSFADALANVAGTTSRVYAVKPHRQRARSGGPFLPGWPIKPTGIIQNTLPLIGPGHDPSLVKVGGQSQGRRLGDRRQPFALRRQRHQDCATSSSSGRTPSTCSSLLPWATWTPTGLRTSSSTRSTWGRRRTCCSSVRTRCTRIASAPTTRATAAPKFGPGIITDDYQFLSSSTVAKVTSGPTNSNQVLAGTGLGLLHAYDGVTGQGRPGLPEDDGRLALRTGGALERPADRRDHQGGLPLRVGRPRRARLPAGVALLPPRRAGHRELRRRRHAPGRPGRPEGDRARGRDAPRRVHLPRR